MDQAQSATRNAASNIRQSLGTVESSFKSIAKIAASFISVKAITSFGKSCVELGSSLTEVQNVVDVTFGEMSSQIDAFAQKAKKQFGLSEVAAKEYASTMGATLKSSGFNVSQAMTMSTTLTGLAADLASFRNLSTDEAFSKIMSGINGVTQPLAALGIRMNEANLSAFALSKGITKSYSAMTEAEKIVLRYNYLLDATKDVQGDYSRTFDSWANQMKELKRNFEDLKATLGQGFIMALKPILEFINKILERLQVLAQKFKLVMAIITGQDLNEVFGSKNMSTNMDAVATAADETSDSVDGITDSMKDANKEVKAFLLGFDEIHKLGSSSENEDLSALGDLDTTSVSELITDDAIDGLNSASDAVDDFNGGLGLTQEEIEELKAKLEPIRSFFAELWNTISSWWNENMPQFIETWNTEIWPVLQNWGALLDKLWTEHLYPLLGNIWSFIQVVWHELLEPFVKWFAEQGFEEVTDVIGSMADTTGGVVDIAKGIFYSAVGSFENATNDWFGWFDKEHAQELMARGNYHIANGAYGTWQGATDIGAHVYDWFGDEEHGSKAWAEATKDMDAGKLFGIENWDEIEEYFGNGKKKKSKDTSSDTAERELEAVEDVRDTLDRSLEVYQKQVGLTSDLVDSENKRYLTFEESQQAAAEARSMAAAANLYGQTNSGMYGSNSGYIPQDTSRPLTFEEYKQALKEALDEQQQYEISLYMDGLAVGYGAVAALTMENAQFNPEIAVTK